MPAKKAGNGSSPDAAQTASNTDVCVSICALLAAIPAIVGS